MTTARFWVHGDVPAGVANYLRSVLVRTVAAQNHRDVWVLLSMLYGLSEEMPVEFSEVQARANAAPSSAFRCYTDWARRQNTSSEYKHMELPVVAPDGTRVANWLRERVRRNNEYNSIYTDDLETLLVLAQAADIATLSAGARCRNSEQLQLPIVLLGESGTGKEFLAKAMHNIHMRVLEEARSPTKNTRQNWDKSFGPINCGGLPAKLVESELFGHKKGSFTGADESREGIIPRCAKGTVFLDEIGDTPLEIQLCLLRFLNDGEVRPVGSDSPLYCFPWVIAATHRDLSAFVAEGRFREDLLNRLRGYVLTLKPLRLRGDDALGALEACVSRHAGFEITLDISFPASRALREYAWPGNLRVIDQFARQLVQERTQELQFQRSVIWLDINDLPPEIQMSYFATHSYADVLVGQYTEEVRTLSETERSVMRESLMRHYNRLVGVVVPEVRFVRSMAKLVRTEVAIKLIDDQNDHRKMVHAVEALSKRIALNHEEKFLKALCAIDGTVVPSQESETELVEDLPAWLRRTLALIEAFAGNPDVSAGFRELETWLNRLLTPVKALVMDLLTSLAEEVRDGDIEDDDEPVIDVRTPSDLHWKELKVNKSAFQDRLNKAGSIAALARELRLDPKTVSKAADQLGVDRPTPRKSSGKSPGSPTREHSEEVPGTVKSAES